MYLKRVTAEVKKLQAEDGGRLQPVGELRLAGVRR
jgi:hypothetical protein